MTLVARSLSTATLLLSLLGCRHEVVTPEPAPRSVPSVQEPTPPATPGAARKPPEAAPPALAFPVGNKARARKAADDCWADPACSAEEAAQRTRAAVLAGDEQYDCQTAFHGVGMARDLRLARVCFDHAVKVSDGCSGSPSIDQGTYAVMLINGQAGPPDVEKARSLLAPCFQDASVSGILAHADDPDRPGDAEFCFGLGVTTLAMNDCGSIHALRDERRALLASKELAASLDPAGKGLVEKLVSAWKQVAQAQGALAYDQTRVGDFVGTMSGQLQRGEISTLFGLEVEALQSLGQAGAAGGAARLTEASKDALKEADAERKKLLTSNEKAWSKVRSAYVALAIQARGASAGPAAASWIDDRHAAALSRVTHLLQ